jgi:hypothetical protein
LDGVLYLLKLGEERGFIGIEPDFSSSSYAEEIFSFGLGDLLHFSMVIFWLALLIVTLLGLG